ncbi:MAG: porin family protein [Bacteroides sp.]|nr:porin family protein [Bacteroides sp.]
MRKIISAFMIAICCMLVATPAQAQLLEWGIKGGVNLATVDVKHPGDNFDKDKMGGFFIGPMAEITIPIIGLGVDGALLFSQKGIKSDVDATKQYGLDIPVNLKYTIGLGSMLGIFVAAGPDFYFDFSKKEQIAGADIDRKKTQVGINLGVGVKLIKHLQLGVNYNIPMGDSFTWKNAYDGVTSKAKTKTWQLSAAYLF